MRVTGVRSRLIRFVWVVVVITTFVPLTAAADDAASARRTPSIRESASQIVARDVSAARVPPVRATAARQVSTPTASTSFFKSRPGMIALALAAAGTGYAIYSAQHDRIHSAGKQ